MFHTKQLRMLIIEYEIDRLVFVFLHVMRKSEQPIQNQHKLEKLDSRCT